MTDTRPVAALMSEKVNNMDSKPPKSMKNPVMIAGKWEERVTPPPTAGTTMVDIKDPETDKESKEVLKGVPFRKADIKK